MAISQTVAQRFTAPLGRYRSPLVRTFGESILKQPIEIFNDIAAIAEQLKSTPASHWDCDESIFGIAHHFFLEGNMEMVQRYMSLRGPINIAEKGNLLPCTITEVFFWPHLHPTANGIFYRNKHESKDHEILAIEHIYRDRVLEGSPWPSTAAFALSQRVPAVDVGPILRVSRYSASDARTGIGPYTYVSMAFRYCAKSTPLRPANCRMLITRSRRCFSLTKLSMEFALLVATKKIAPGEQLVVNQARSTSISDQFEFPPPISQFFDSYAYSTKADIRMTVHNSLNLGFTMLNDLRTIAVTHPSQPPMDAAHIEELRRTWHWLYIDCSRERM